MLQAPNLARFEWLTHGFGLRDSQYPAKITTVRQVHSNVVVDARSVDASTQADALISDLPGTIIGVRTADCVPILIADERLRAVAAVHAGWRGTAQLIAVAAVRELITHFGARLADLHAAIGPAIGLCCYEVGSEVARQFGYDDSGPTHLDLAGINEQQLRVAGVRDVWRADECTFCGAERFYSYRREKEQAGRMRSFIGSIQTAIA